MSATPHIAARSHLRAGNPRDGLRLPACQQLALRIVPANHFVPRPVTAAATPVTLVTLAAFAAFAAFTAITISASHADGDEDALAGVESHGAQKRRVVTVRVFH
jgi:hypothetical protein